MVGGTSEAWINCLAVLLITAFVGCSTPTLGMPKGGGEGTEVANAVQGFLDKSLLYYPLTDLALTHVGEDFPIQAAGLTSRYLLDGLKLLNNSPFNLGIVGIQVNQPIRPDYINLYFLPLDQNTPPALERAQSNCIYTGHSNIIVCDAYWIATYLNLPMKHSSIVDNEIVEAIATRADIQRDIGIDGRLVVLRWIIGHELGHIAYKHHGNHFSSSKIKGITLHERLSKPYGTSAEEEADDFAMSIYSSPLCNTNNEGCWFGSQDFISMSTLVQSEYNKAKACSPEGGPVLVRQQSSTHPPLLVRITRMGIKCLRQCAELLKYVMALRPATPQHYERILGDIEVVEQEQSTCRV